MPSQVQLHASSPGGVNNLVKSFTMPRPDSFSITLFPAPEKGETKQPRRPPPTSRRRSASRVLQLLAGHCPSEILDRTALNIIDYAYTALLEIAPPEGGQSVFEVSAPVDPADPYSPLLHVDASSTHCRIRLPYSRPAPLAGGPDDDGRTCVEQIKKHPGPSPSRASLSVSPAAVHLQARVVVGAGDRKVRWRFVDARPDASSEGLLTVLRTIGSILEEAISRETTLLEMARTSGFGRSPKAHGIVTVRTALEEMRGVLDVDAMITHRRRQKRCRSVREISCPPADAEMLTNKMRTLHVDEVQDDAEVLAKRLRTLRV